MLIPNQRATPTVEHAAQRSAAQAGGMLLLMPCMTLPEWHLMAPMGRWLRARVVHVVDRVRP